MVPYKLAFGTGGSFYTFGFQGDEYDYAQRLQPLLPGTTPLNSINGIQDPKLASPIYLEDALRPVLELLHIDVIGFFWVWRILFPVALLLLLMLLARECFPARAGIFVPAAAAAAALPLLACGIELLRAIPATAKFYAPIQGLLSRVPTNIEFILSALLALLFVRFITWPDYRRGIAVALISALSVYVRMYVALTWAPVIGAVTCWLYLKGRMRFSVGATMLLVLIAALIPWGLTAHTNSRSPVYGEFMIRCFGNWPYQISPLMMIYIVIAVLLFGGGLLTASRYRPLITLSALSMLAWPFASGLLSFSRELMLYDRFVEFYGIGLVLTAFLGLGAYAVASRCDARTLVLPLAAIALASSIVLGYQNYSYNYLAEPESPYRNVAVDQACVPAYTWIHDHVDPDALFLVDDGYDWSLVFEDGPKTLSGSAPDGTAMLSKGDLFQLVARRKRVYNEHVMYGAMSDDQFLKLMILHRGTFGFPIQFSVYDRALLDTWPTHIFWRKLPLNPVPPAPIPRGVGTQLRKFSYVIYEDATCEVWELNFAMILPIYRGPAQPQPDLHQPPAPYDRDWFRLRH